MEETENAEEGPAETAEEARALVAAVEDAVTAAEAEEASADDERLTAAAYRLRAALTPPAELLDLGAAPIARVLFFTLTHAGSSAHAPLCLECLWALTNLTASSSKACVALVAHPGFVATTLEHLNPQTPVLMETAMWMLGNLLRDAANVYDGVVERPGILRAMYGCVFPPALETMSAGIARTCAWAVTGLFAGRREDVERDALESLKGLFVSSVDETVIREISHGLWNWIARWNKKSRRERYERRHVLAIFGDDGGGIFGGLAIARTIVSMVKTPRLAGMGLKLAGHVCSMDTEWAGTIVNKLLLGGLLDALTYVLIREESANEKNCNDALWTLSNILAGTEWHARRVVDHGILRLVPAYFASAPHAREACWCVANLVVLRPRDMFRDGLTQLPAAWAMRVAHKHLSSWWHAALAIAIGDVRALDDWSADRLAAVADEEGHGLECVAAASGHVPVLQWLLRRAPALAHRPNPKTGALPIATAALYQHADVVRMLIELGAQDEPGTVEPPHRALFVAARNHQFDRRLVRRLLDAGFTMGATPAAAALVTNGANPIVRFATLYANEWSPLHRAVAARDYAATLEALRAGFELEDALVADADAAACSELAVDELLDRGPRAIVAVVKTRPRLVVGGLTVQFAIGASFIGSSVWNVPMLIAACAECPRGGFTLTLEATTDDAAPLPDTFADLAGVAPPLGGLTLRSTAFREFPRSVYHVAETHGYPFSNMPHKGILELLESARRLWSPETHHTFPHSARARARVVLTLLQYKRPLAGSARAGLDDLWLRILEFAIVRGDD